MRDQKESTTAAAVKTIAARIAHDFLIESRKVTASTRSIIGMEIGGGRIKYIYCHFDSYNNLSFLRRFYSDPIDAKELIDGGSIRSLTENIEDIPRYGDDAEIASSLDQIKNDHWTDYYFLYRGGRWVEVSAGLPSRQTKPDLREVHTIEAEEVLRRSLGAGLAEPDFQMTLTMQEEGHNKYHFFAIYESNGMYIGGNAYGAIGAKVRTIEIMRGSKASVYAAVNAKIRTKKAKGYMSQ